MPAIDYRAARSQLHLVEVLDLAGYQPRSRQGDQLRGSCPLHGSGSATSRSFAAHLGKNVFHCFRCGASGNALDLWTALTRLPLHAAVLDLCRRLGRPVPWLAHPTQIRNKMPCRRSPLTRGDADMPAP
jgi:DNA primase